MMYSEIEQIIMEGSEQPSSLQSICHVRASEVFPKAPLETEDKRLVIPFTPLCGEYVEFLGRTADGVLALSNYRLYLQLKDTEYNVPLGLIEQLEVRDIFFLHVGCKDARSLRLTFTTNEHCLDWFRRLHRATAPPKGIEDLFAFAFFAWLNEEGQEEVQFRLGRDAMCSPHGFRGEVERLKFDVHCAWRVSNANADHKLCQSYPRQLLVPACISDETLELAARFRSARRVPAVVWRHTGNGAVIARCSQPEVGWLGWRSSEDEDLLKAIADACAYDRGHSTLVDATNCNGLTSTPTKESTPPEELTESPFARHENKKVLIMDARSYTTAVANRARGGGCECPEYYPSCEIQFMNLANIHSIRKSFHAVRQLCAAAADQSNWFSLLEGTRWLLNISGLLRAAVTVVSAVDQEGRPVLVHCSDGWDRTPQIVALAELLLDPYYRTVDGFQVLCEREWLDFGHKFGDRCGHAVGSDDANERCPVFLQWLDCVHQLLRQFPCAFEFSHCYLVKLAQHTYSNLFGTFLCNSAQERAGLRVYERTFSVWKFLRAPNFRNHLYCAKDQVLWPSCNVRDLVLWSEVYLGAGETPSTTAGVGRAFTGSSNLGAGSDDDAPVVAPTSPQLSKTRSYDDLLAAAEHTGDMQRRSSDPSISLDNKFDGISLTNGAGDQQNGTDWPQQGDLVRENGIDSTRYSATGIDLRRDLSDEGVIDVQPGEDSDDNEEESITESKSEMTICANPMVNGISSVKEVASSPSVDSSTDTLVAGEVNGVAGEVNGIGVHSLTPGEPAVMDNPVSNGKTAVLFNGMANNSNNSETISSGDVCRVCASSRRFLADNRDGSASSSTSGKTSRYSTPPLYSRTPSSGYPATPSDERLPPPTRFQSHNRLDDLDGMQPLRSDVQMRLQQIIAEHRAKEESLQRELHTTRLALIQQVCHHCNHNTADRPDDVGSLPESMCSGEQPSAGESLPSDVSWEAVEEREAGPTLWVPDHAVNRCMGCDTEFWLGRRKHHCRNCGKIFCADCSENTVPLPREQLYDPVRVCSSCFSLLHDTTALRRYTEKSMLYPLTNGYSSLEPENGRTVAANIIAAPDNCKQSTPAVSGTSHKTAVTAAST
ncbi:myotubularin-related protein 3 isoform X2 [Anabrus simplex]|uniref:myotubularin-related protein 3 isoform X2 n=1 Tax=Anabrus simplex TaxID=316456 RepID=UPI0035A2F77F